MVRILGIESSCDETGIAVVEDGRVVIADALASQIELHKVFGGVVPEIASRQHTKIISQLTKDVMQRAGGDVDAIAVTYGPGLMGSLLVGVCFAKALAYSWGKPLVPVHHLEGHIFSAFLGDTVPNFPFLCLIVSGGHTQLVRCDAPHHYEILGSTRDDAVGESFDKVARLLGLGYPGGPAIQKAALEGNREAYAFPRSMKDSGNLEFSYSGLKTAVMYTMREHPENLADVAASFEEAAVDLLLIKTRKALEMTGLGQLVVAGGVAANQRLRTRLQELDAQVFLPPFKYCIDNGAMIAAAGHSRYLHGFRGDIGLTPQATLPLS